MKEERKLLTIISSLSSVGMYISGAGILIMALIITLEVIGRYFLGFSLLVTDEWSGYLMVAVTFLGLAYTMRERGFLRMELLIKRLSPQKRNFLNIILILVALTYSVLIDYKLFLFAWSSYTRGYSSISISQTPLYIPQIFMSLGMTLLVLELFREGLQSFYDWIAPNAHYQKGRNKK
jgi:TRAP-type C4-dicarboxylate transport system permease small subunit